MPDGSFMFQSAAPAVRTFEILSYEELSEKRSLPENRYFIKKGEEGIRYFMNHVFYGNLAERADYSFVVCTGAPQEEVFYAQDSNGNSVKYTEIVTPVIGMVELQINPYNRSEVWLKFVSVLPKFHGNGIGRELGVRLAAHVKEIGLKLSRSSPSELAKEKGFHQMLSNLLNEAGVEWTQSNY